MLPCHCHFKPGCFKAGSNLCLSGFAAYHYFVDQLFQRWIKRTFYYHSLKVHSCEQKVGNFLLIINEQQRFFSNRFKATQHKQNIIINKTCQRNVTYAPNLTFSERWTSDYYGYNEACVRVMVLVHWSSL